MPLETELRQKVEQRLGSPESGMPALKLNHLGVAVPNLDQAVPFYQEIFGYAVLAGPYDDPIQNVSVCFLGAGGANDLAIELVAPLGERSPVVQLLAKGVAAYHLCYEVHDIDQALTDVRAKGCVIVGKPVPAVAFQGRRIAWFYTPSKQLVEFVEVG